MLTLKIMTAGAAFAAITLALLTPTGLDWCIRSSLDCSPNHAEAANEKAATANESSDGLSQNRVPERTAVTCQRTVNAWLNLGLSRRARRLHCQCCTEA